MTLNLAGWVECKNPLSWLPQQWMPAIDLSSMLKHSNLALDALFLQGDTPGLEPVAPGRGVPPDVSRFVEMQLREAESAHDIGIVEVSWITWCELESVSLRPRFGPDWQLLFRLLDYLAEVCGDEHVRLVVWIYADA